MMEQETMLSNLLTSLIPDGNQEFEKDGIKYTVKKDGDNLEIRMETIHPEFDDSETKDLINEYKENIKAIDDELFLDVVEELKNRIDLREFNDLLDQESFNEEEANKVEEMINISADITTNLLQEKIQNLVNLYERF